MTDANQSAPPEGLRRQLLEATLACAAESGFKLSVEEVTHRAGVSRATVYRYFDGGKEELISEAVRWEVARFFQRIAVEVADAPDLASTIERALSFGREALLHHQLLQKVLLEEPEQLVAELELTMPIVEAGLRDYLRPFLESEDLAPGVSVDEAAEYLSRMFLTYLGAGGRWDVSDPDQVHRLVGTQFLGGILA